ncbi:MAG: hypothetical protein HY905_08025 [Deltaproteobacteria bacterium]|nr:hypothetical protein [Deltaproteobacteria bacterium]
MNRWSTVRTVAVVVALALPVVPGGCGGDTILASNDGTGDPAAEGTDGVPEGEAADADAPDAPPVDAPDGDTEAAPDRGTDGDADADADVIDGGADPWIPPIDDAGETGWRDSETPWTPPPAANCDAGTFGGTPLDLWSRPDGVFVLFGWLEGSVEEGTATEMLGVWQNVGDGWTPFYRGGWSPECRDECGMQIGGSIDGRLLAWMPGETIYGVAPDAMEVLWPELFGIGPDVVVVGDDLAYTSWQAGGDARIVRWDGTDWSPLPVPLPFSEAYQARLWADADDLFVAGPYALLLSLEGGDWLIHDAGSLTTFTAIWGFDGDDVWVGGSRGELKRFDGAAWVDVAWPTLEVPDTCVDQTPIRGMWGADGVLYFVTSTQFARWDGTDVEVLGYWPDVWDPGPPGGRCVPDLRLVTLWGNSPTEVFLVVARPPSEPGREYCNDIAVLRWDGTTFHQM